MPLRHGSKIYCQLLLDANRYRLAEELAASQEKKVTAMLREIVYEALEKAVPFDVYEEALAADEKVWKESIQRRVEGRQRSRREREESGKDA